MRHFKLVVILFFPIILFANAYEENCMSCHGQFPGQLRVFMNKYTIKYSSEDKIKKAIYTYLKNPTKQNSIMPMGFLNRFGIKEKSNLSEQELNEAIDIYYKKFNLRQYIK
jgi:uncharacterized membrane protein